MVAKIAHFLKRGQFRKPEKDTMCQQSVNGMPHDFIKTKGAVTHQNYPLIYIFCCIFQQFQWITYDVYHLIYHPDLFIVQEHHWINCQLELSTRLVMTHLCFKRGKTTPGSHCWTFYGKPNPVTVVVLKSFSPAQGFQYQRRKSLESSPSPSTQGTNFMKTAITPTSDDAHA